MSKFEELKKKLTKKGVKSPSGLAAYIGRKKLGKKEFQNKAELGKKKED